MPSIINATTSTGLVSSADNSGSLQLATNNGTTAVTIDTSQNVGIGTASPGQKLEVLKAGGGAIRISETASRYVEINGYGEGSANGSVMAFNTITAGTSSLVERGRFDNAGNFLFNSGYGSVATAYGCRAWVNFNGSGTPAIRVARNVSSITDYGDMYYGINFSTAMPDANYAWSASGSNVNNDAGTNFTGWTTTSPGNNQNTNALNLRGLNIYNGGANQSGDCALVTVAIFR
jgi:hypothetical protein